MNRHDISRLIVIAVSEWRKATRSRMFLSLVLTGSLLLAFTQVLAGMTISGPDRVIQTGCFFIIGLYGLVTSGIIGIDLIRQEFREKTIYLILSKPVPRHVYMLGKFAGMLLVMITIFLIFTIIAGVLFFMNSISVSTAHVAAFGFIFLEWCVLAAFSLFLSVFTNSFLHGFILFCFYFFGHLSRDLLLFSTNVSSRLLGSLLKGLYFAVPNLELYNFRQNALYQLPLELIETATSTMTGLAWILCFITAAVAVFSVKRVL